MDKNTKILTICQKGVCRSVGTRYRLCRRGFTNVISIGARNTSATTLNMLCGWADKILLAHPRFSDIVPADCVHKVDTNFSIGTDKWYNAQHRDLQNLLRKKLSHLGYK